MTESSANALEVRINGPIWLVVACRIPDIAPVDVLPWFVEPAKLRQWWGQEHEIAPRSGGSYIVKWPAIGKTLRGQIAHIGETSLVFSWTFDDEPELPAYVVAINIHEREGGSTLEIRHGAYRSTATGVTERQSHLEGWQYFLPQLLAAIAVDRA